MDNNEKAEKIFECISDVMPDNEKKFKSFYITKICDALESITSAEDDSNEWQEWHKEEGHQMAKRESEDWLLAERCKKTHTSYANDQILISEVWRDKSNTLCVRYIRHMGKQLDWFHYVIENSEVTWW